MERLVVFEPGEVGERPPLHVALHPQGARHVDRLVVQAALVPRRLQGCMFQRKEQGVDVSLED